MIKKILYIVCLGLLAFGCKRIEVENPNVNGSGVAIGLGIDMAGGAVAGASSRAIGTVDDVADFGSDTLALYGINEAFAGTQYWEKDKRVIDTLAATVDADGKIMFSKEKKYYPASGYLSVYSIYPAGNGYVDIDDSDPVGVIPSATVILAEKSSLQYDVMTGKAEKLTVAQSQRAKVTFDHALAMLRIKVYRQDVNVSATVSKITVRGVSKATLADIRKPIFTNSTVVTDSLYFEAYKDVAGTVITAANATDAQSIGTSLMLFPGKASVSEVVITVDGNNYTTVIPSSWTLNQGKINTLTLCIRPFEVRFEKEWTISAWADGDDVTSGLENNGKHIRVSVPMINAAGGLYNGTMPVRADVEIDGNYTHKDIAVESTNGGVLVTKPFNSGSLNNEPMYMTAIKLYRGDGNVIFEGKLYGGKLSTGQKVVIDTIHMGKLKVGNESGEEFKLNMDFGGMGNGTIEVPYEVATALHLKNVANFKGSVGSRKYDGTSANGAVFAQVEDIDLKSVIWAPIGTTAGKFYGRYNGNGYMIRNIKVSTADEAGLFGYVEAPTGGAGLAEISNVTIVNGTIDGRSKATGAVVGYMSNGLITNCYNGAAVAGPAGNFTAGIVGFISGSTVVISGCINTGNISASANTTGGVAGIVGKSNLATTVQDCYNAGSVKQNVTADAYVGGIIGTYTKHASILKNSYNRGVVTTISASTTAAGAVLGYYISGVTMNRAFGNNYYLTGTHSKGVGTNANSTAALTDPYTEKSESDLKLLDITLGAAWQSDYSDTPINDGFPILKWQTKQWYQKLKQ